MKQIKIVHVHAYAEYEDSGILRNSITDWEEVSEEAYQFLRENWYRICDNIQQEYGNVSVTPLLIVKDNTHVTARIMSVYDLIQQEQAKQAKVAAERHAKAEAKKQKEAAAKAERERKLLEELKQKYPDA
jgi:hypothetical protein